MKEQIIKLLKLKSIITLALISTVCIGFYINKIDAETIKTLTLTVIAYFFGKADNKQEV